MKKKKPSSNKKKPAAKKQRPKPPKTKSKKLNDIPPNTSEYYDEEDGYDWMYD